MGKILFYGVVFFMVLSCKQETGKEVDLDTQETFFSVDSLPKPVAVNVKAVEILKDWQAFKDMETAFESLYRVANREDLTLVIEDLIEKQKLLENSEYPAVFNKSQIKSRQKVFQTFILKTKRDLQYFVNAKESTLEMIAAYNAYRNQFNVLMNSELDLNLIMNE
ncbi:hypothetical protein KCTC52924_00979 [Arenibacter antarcticus]|uniref:Uncharacterized protein n=1 Tax=Arenibacter antarcticus TaxID=2040469 RepID=A0ABW5VBF9_9FLAO|nr:hypothetical protein [Arenibacter sp. H213]MCM4167522.1 hypothetical protein [Arenibacter sp. H213]